MTLPIRTEPFPQQETISYEERQAVEKVLDSKMLSGYRGNFSRMMGGPGILKLIEDWKEYFDVPFAIPTNSCTSALQIACGAIGLKSGDEVIVTPWSMTCSATAPMVYGATPIFADIDPDTFCIDPVSVREKITPRTKAIIAVDLFGNCCDWDELRKIANEHDIYLIQDAAQAIGGKYKGEWVGKQGDISCFSFTSGKILTAGEGGMLMIPNFSDSMLADNCSLILNHAEAVVNDLIQHGHLKNPIQQVHLVGNNMRMTEIQAAILREQLKKLKRFTDNRNSMAGQLYRLVEGEAPGIIQPDIDKQHYSFNPYYAQAFLYDEKIVGVHRDKFIDAVNAELIGGEKGRPDKKVMVGKGYIKPIYLMPLFKFQRKDIYQEGLCPVAEDLFYNKLFVWTLQGLPLNGVDLGDIRNAFKKVYANRGNL